MTVAGLDNYSNGPALPDDYHQAEYVLDGPVQMLHPQTEPGNAQHKIGSIVRQQKFGPVKMGEKK